MTPNVVLVFVFLSLSYITLLSDHVQVIKVLIYHAIRIRGYNFSVLTKEPLFDWLLYSEEIYLRSQILRSDWLRYSIFNP